MAWSYDPARLEDALNWIRLKVGDTDTNEQQLSDEEIQSMLLLASGDRLLAAGMSANALAAKYARYGAEAETKVFLQLSAALKGEQPAGYL